MKASPEKIFGGLLATWIILSLASFVFKVELLGKVSMILGFVVVALALAFGGMAVFLMVRERVSRKKP